MNQENPSEAGENVTASFNGSQGTGALLSGQSVHPSVSDMETRGTTESSELQLMERNRLLIDECRKELADLRLIAKSATAHREKSMKLLSQASDAVVALEDVLYSTNLLVKEQEQVIHRMAPRVLAATDNAESIVKTYGQMKSFHKLCSKLTASNATVHGKFSESLDELKRVTEQTRRANEEGLSALSNLVPSSGVPARSQGVAWNNGRSHLAPASSTPVPGVEKHEIKAVKVIEGQETKSGSYSDTTLDVTNSLTNIERRASSPATEPESTLMHELSTSPVLSAQRAIGEGIVSLSLSPNQIKPVRKGSRQETFVAAQIILHTMPDRNPEDNQPYTTEDSLWLYSTRFLSSNLFLALGLSSEIKQAIYFDKNLAAVSAMHYDPRGVMWTGHKNGMILPWNIVNREPFGKPLRVSSGAIKAISSDELGTAWVGSDKGDVKRVSITQQTAEGGAILGFELKLLGALKHSGSGTAETSAGHEVNENGMVINHRAKERAHSGPITAICAAAGRVWTSGGTPAFLCLREWTQRGEFMSKKDLKVTGAVTYFKLITPFVQVNSPSSAMSSAFSGGTDSSTSGSEVPQSWQLLTGYANGTIGVWGSVHGVLCQLLRIGRQAPPVTGLAVSDELGLICTSHLDGKLRLRVPPRLCDRDKLQISYMEKTISTVNLHVTEVSTSQTGDCLLGVHATSSGIFYISASAAISFVSNESLLSILEQSGGKILQGLSKLQELSAGTASRITQLNGQPSESMAEPKVKGSLFPKDASQWMIDYHDLSKTRVIGEGAFGKVYLGKWHETDVAIKALTSLGALGFGAGNIASHATESDVKDALKTLEREVALMVAMRHPNVILFMGVCPEPPCVVTEFCSRGSLYDLLKAAKEDNTISKSLTWYRRLGMLMDAAKGMLYLHSHRPPIIHRDLKSPNLLVDNNWRVKVTDFNLSRLSDVAQQQGPGVASSVVANNPRWHAPEIIKDAYFSKEGDVYAFGLIMWELITWELPFDGMSSFQIILFVGEKAGRPMVPPADELESGHGTFPAYTAYIELMNKCWAQDPSDRPGFPAIISNLREIMETVPGHDEKDAVCLSEQAEESPEVMPGEETADIPVSDGPVPVSAVKSSPFDSSFIPSSTENEQQTVSHPQGPFAASPFDAPAASPSPASAPSPFDAPVVSPSPASAPSPFDAPAGNLVQATPERRSAVIDSVSEGMRGRMPSAS